MNSNLLDKFKGCILGGAIGDAWGSSFENLVEVKDSKNYYLGNKPEVKHIWQFTDDTILTLATCEVLKTGSCTPELLGNKFIEYYDRNEIVGIGASTLKSINDLKAGYHWTQAGRKGEYGAGNGSAMRIAPFAFYDKYTKDDIRNFSKLTHNNDEAYVGALSIYLILKQIISNETFDFKQTINDLIIELPDTNVRDRIIELNENYLDRNISDIAKLGNNGYVVNSIPFSMFSAFKLNVLGFENIISEVINCGGDTDTNASIAGQIMGTILGYKKLPKNLITKLENTNKYYKIENILD